MMSAIRWRDTSKLAVPAIASLARLPAHQALRPAAIEIAMATHPGTSPHCHSIDRVCRKPNGNRGSTTATGAGSIATASGSLTGHPQTCRTPADATILGQADTGQVVT